MKKIFFSIIATLILCSAATAQLNVGGTLAPKSGAALEVTSGGTKGFLGPKVVLTNQNVWAPLADTAIEGMIVFNLGTNAGFPTKGYFYWLDGKWTSLGSITSGDGGTTPGGTDLIATKLSGTSLTNYNNAAIGDWISITTAEFTAISNMSGAVQIGTPKSITTGTAENWSELYYPCSTPTNASAGTRESPQANVYCTAIAFNTAPTTNTGSGTASTAKVLVGSVDASNTSLVNMIPYGNNFSFTLVQGGVYCFVCKKPGSKTPANTTSPLTSGGALGLFIQSSGDIRPLSMSSKPGYRPFLACAQPGTLTESTQYSDKTTNITGIGFGNAQW